MMLRASSLRRHAKALASDVSGVVMVEFALVLPFLFGITAYGIEVANLAYTTQLTSDIAVQSADSIARIRTSVSEQDVTDILAGTKTIGDRIDFANNGRIIVSALEPVTNASNTVTNQKILWQRCSGALRKNSSYGVEGANVGLTGMGPNGKKITASQDMYVVVVEVQYHYQPLISRIFVGDRTSSVIAAMPVREREENNIGSTGTKSSCSTYKA